MTRQLRKKATPPASPSTAANERPQRKWFVVAGLALLLAIAGAFFLASWSRTPAPSSPASLAPVAAAEAASPVSATYVGAESCKTCHEPQFKAWSGSHHQLAMQEASAATVLGDFAKVSFRHNGVESLFFKRGDQFMVRTDGPDGKLADYEIRYTFGLYPLQQYLIPFPGGRYQTLPIAWDTRPKGEGGQRWFHLYPDQKIDHKDPLHWTGLYQNWALQCAECHSTQQFSFQTHARRLLA